MAWVRTATSLISFDFTIYKFFEFEVGRGVATTSRMLSPRTFLMIMIGTGLVALLLSTIDHRHNIRVLQTEFGIVSRMAWTLLRLRARLERHRF